jgi:CrcB protein
MQLPELVVGAGMVIAGAMVGTPLRFFVSGVVARRVGETFPWGTLVVNVSGCLIAGAVAAFVRSRGLSSASDAWLLVVTGFLGSYTTVSSFALQTRALAEDGEYRFAAAYILLSVLLCVGSVALVFAIVSALIEGGS